MYEILDPKIHKIIADLRAGHVFFSHIEHKIKGMAKLVYPDGVLELILNRDSQLPLDTSIQKINANEYLVIRNNEVFNVSLYPTDQVSKWNVTINHKSVEVELKEDADLLLEKLGMSASGKSVAKEIKAPMPGLILEIPVIEGNTVEIGQIVMVLEAMKMENLLKSNLTGTVAKVLVKKGDKVEKNQVLITFV